MKHLYILVAVFLLACSVAHAQVSVKGYYRKNGTYVAPHQRTRPNQTVTDNYSYPGNGSPNGSGASSTGTGTTRQYQSGSSTSSGSSQPAGNPYTKELIAPGVYRFDSPGPVSMRAEPSLTGAEIYTCPRNATVQVLESPVDDNMYCKALVNGHTGYIAWRLIAGQAPAKPATAVLTGNESDFLEPVAKARGMSVPVLIQTLAKEEALRLGLIKAK
jgi:hypothetical protein